MQDTDPAAAVRVMLAGQSLPATRGCDFPYGYCRLAGSPVCRWAMVRAERADWGSTASMSRGRGLAVLVFVFGIWLGQ